MRELSGLPDKKNVGERVSMDPMDSMMGKSPYKRSKKKLKSKKILNKKEMC
jgi:hypothetical protein